MTTEELRTSLKAAAKDSDAKGAGDNLLKSLFDEYVESCIEGLRWVIFTKRLGCASVNATSGKLTWRRPQET